MSNRALDANIPGNFSAFRPIRIKSKPRKTNFIPRYDRNLYIKAPTLRVISDSGENLGILDRETALQKAREQEVDLVLINPQSEPPIAKLIPWTKFKYEQSKKRRTQKGTTVEVKEMRFKPLIEAGDIAHKLHRVQEFLDKGHKVRLHIMAKRRDDPKKVAATAARIYELASEFSIPESEMRREGFDYSTIVKPKK